MIIASLLALSTAAMADGTRGIGQYPGAPSEFFGPTIVWSESGQLTNVALHRMAFASSTYDYNHTAHLVTDGLVGNEPPAILRASTPSGPLPRREAEWAIDGGKFEATSRSRAGLLLWMSHPCWPSLVWQTYDYYLEPTAAYFGAKKACEPLHIQYNALTDSIEVVNHSAGLLRRLTATATVYDLQGRKVAEKRGRLDSRDDSTLRWLHRSALVGSAPSDVYFLRLTLTGADGILSENTYVMGREENNYRALTTLPPADIEVKERTLHTPSATECSLAVDLRNKGKTPIGLLRLQLKGADGEQILPVVYSDNYLTLMPGEHKTIIVSWRAEDARNQQPHIEAIDLLCK